MHVELTEEQKIKVNNAKGVFQVMKQILLRENEIDINKEHFWCLGLAVSNKLLYIELISLGSLRKTVVEPMDIFSWALQKRVDKIVLVHNHPSGELIASNDDQDLTNRLIQVGKIINIPVVDHLIITTKDFYSFQKTGLLEILERSKKYVPDYLLVERIKAEAQQIGEKIGRKEGRKEGMEKGKKKGREETYKEMAINMKKDGEPFEKISKYTGLSKEEIEKL